MKLSLPTPKRIVLLVLASVAVFGCGVAATHVTLGVLGDRKALAVAEAHDAATVWMELTDRFEMLSIADPFLLPIRTEGDAAELYWPDAAAGEECGVPGGPRLFEYTEMLFEKWPDRMRAALACPRIDDMVKAASLPAMDMAGRLAARKAGYDYFGTYDAFREPYQALQSLLVRAHARIRARDWSRAEQDARAVVSAGRQFVWHSPDVHGMSLGVMLMTGGLDHLRALYERQGDAQRAKLALAARDLAGELERRVNRILEMGRGTSRFPKLLRYAVAAAENEGLPLGVRSTMVVYVGYGHLGHFVERFLGPCSTRVRALARLARNPELGLAVAEARKGLNLSLRARLDLASQWTL